MTAVGACCAPALGTQALSTEGETARKCSSHGCAGGVDAGANTIYFHGGEPPGYNSFMGYDPNNHVTLVVWTNLPVSLDEKPTANALMLKVLDQIYIQSPLAPPDRGQAR
jgi:hypothetical protein